MNRTALLVSILAGTKTADEVAARLGCSTSEIEAEVRQLTHALQRAGRPRRLPRPAVLSAVVASVIVVGLLSRSAWGQAACTSYPGLPALLRTMCADAPARAEDVNFNNKQLADYVAQKVGALGSANVSISGSLDFGTSTRQMLNLWAQEYGVGVQASTTYVRSGGGFAWFRGGAHSDSTNDPGAGGTRVMELTSGGLLRVGALNVNGGSTVGKIVYGTFGNCTAGNAPAGPQGVSFGATFASTPLVFAQPEEPDQSGCTSVRVTSRSTTGFTYQAWTGGSPSACDCIHWVAIGP